MLIVGAGRVGQSIAEYIDDHCELGLRVVGFLDESNVQGAAVLGTLADLPRIARRNFVDEVFITSSERSVLRDIADHASSNRMDVKVVPEIFNGLGYGAPLHYLGEFPVIELHSQKIPAYGLVIKRMMDIAFSASALAFASPLLALIALAIKIDSRGPVIYRSTRVGRRGRHFTCFKFRTMVLDAHEMQKDLHHLNERNGPLFKISNDPRITRLGQFLRKWSLDEIPQFFNVLIGDMSLVGPRPAVPEEVHQYSEREVARMAVQPGLTGLWQVTARQDPSFETYVRLDLHYIRHWTLLLDFDILLRTVPAVLRGTGV